jgi:hypothetical protein
MPSMTIRQKLAEQRGFLNRSVQAFEVHPEEALRIATTIRVLVHETSVSKPLLGLLCADYRQLPILDKAPPTTKTPTGVILYYCGVGMRLTIDKGVQPIIDLSLLRGQLVPLETWWNQCLLIFTDEKGNRVVFTRKSLLLTLANREGGAHVDTDLPPEYERYILNSSLPIKCMVNDIETDYFNVARFAAVQSAVQLIDCLDRNFA